MGTSTMDGSAINWLSELRSLTPARELSVAELEQVLERQTTRLLKLGAVAGPPVPIHDLAGGMPHVVLRRASGMSVSGRTQWAGRTWVVLVAQDEPAVRQRFTVGHELAHVVLHPVELVCLPATAEQSHEQRLELACDYFAACLLMPRTWVKRAYFSEGIQDVAALARLFEVSFTAMNRRLDDLRIQARLPRRGRPGA